MKNQAFFHRLGFALTGLRTAWRNEKSFKTHVAATVFVLGVLLWFEPAPLWWAVAHLFNHQTHHRGQITTLLMQQGCDPGVTDFYAMLREEAAHASPR